MKSQPAAIRAILRGSAPHRGKRVPGAAARVAALAAAVVAATGGPAGSDPPAAPSDSPPPVADLDGVYVALGPVGSAVYAEGAWDGGFGGEISVVRVREHRPLAALGLGLGALRLAMADRGRVWLDVQVASRRPLGLAAGLSLGATAEVDPVIPPRWGGQATVWLFAGIIPYIRIGVVQKSGTYVDLGIKLALPALRM